MEAWKDSISQAREWCRISRRGVVAAAVLATLAGMAITAGAQAPKRMVIRAGRGVHVRTREVRAHPAMGSEGDKNTPTAPCREGPRPPGGTTIDPSGAPL